MGTSKSLLTKSEHRGQLNPLLRSKRGPRSRKRVEPDLRESPLGKRRSRSQIWREQTPLGLLSRNVPR